MDDYPSHLRPTIGDYPRNTRFQSLWHDVCKLHMLVLDFSGRAIQVTKSDHGHFSQGVMEQQDPAYWTQRETRRKRLLKQCERSYNIQGKFI